MCRLAVAAATSRKQQGEQQMKKQFRLIAVLLGVGLLASACQPKDTRPGLWLSGNPADEHTRDWRFTDDIEEIFVETRSWYGIPHSTTIWCVEHNGELFIGSYGDEKKAWEKNVARDPRATVSISGKLYAVTLVPVTGSSWVEALDAAYAKKYDMADVFGGEIPKWWYYRVAARS